MKNIYIVFVIILFFLILKSSNVKGQDAYYYFQNDTIHLFQDSSVVIMFFKEGFAYKNNDKTFSKSANIFDYMVPEYDDEDTLVAILYTYYPIVDIELFLDTLDLSLNDLEGISFGYKNRKGNCFMPTMEVAFRLKQGISISDIRVQNLIDDYDAIFVENNYDVYYFLIPDYDVFEFSNELVESSLVVWASPDYYAEIIPNSDPYYQHQYYLNNTGQIIDGVYGTEDIDIDAPEAWVITKGSSNIKVAILDDGVEREHEDLKDNQENSKVIDGWTANCWDLLFDCSGSHKRKCTFHGTAVAGIIAASHNNKGIKGIAPDIRIVPININKKGGATTNMKRVAEGINKAWDDFEADILNQSWSKHGDPDSQILDAMQNALNYGRNGKGCIIVSSSGNLFTHGNVRFPANADNIIAVGAIDLQGNWFEWSAAGNKLDFVAPSGYFRIGEEGANVRTLDRMGKKGVSCLVEEKNYFETAGGTSAAAPQVAAVSALLLSRNPNLTRQEVYCRLAMTATDLGDFGRDDLYGHGLINAYRAIAYDDMVLTDKTFGGLQDFWASNTITSEGTIIEQGADVTLRSGNQIRVTSGSAKAGSTFRAYIDACDPCAGGGTMMLASNNSFSHNQANADFNISDSELPEIEKDQNQVSETEQLDYAYEFSAFPNPFDNSTTINFSHNKTSRVKIYLTNSYGQEVMQVHNKYTAPGNYEIKIDGNRLQPGVYFCVIETDRGRETIKIVKM